MNPVQKSAQSYDFPKIRVRTQSVGYRRTACLSPGSETLPELSRQELIAEVRSGYVHEVVIVDREAVTTVSTRRGPFRVALRRGDNSLVDELSALGIDVKFETKPLACFKLQYEHACRSPDDFQDLQYSLWVNLRL